jgi:DNA-binding response OmpR family regulator
MSRDELASWRGILHDEKFRHQVALVLAHLTPARRVHDVILRRAIESDQGFDPRDHDGWKRFLSGPLCNAVEGELGSAAAKELRRLLAERFEERERTLGEGTGESEPPTLPSHQQIIIVVACRLRAANQAYVQLFEEAGFAVLPVRDAEAAVAECVLTHADAIVADVDWLDATASELVTRLALELDDRAPPVIVVARELVDVESAAAALRKPFDRAELIDAVNDVIDEGGSDEGRTRLVIEAIDRLATPMVRDALVATALSKAGLESLPEDAAALGELVAGPLRDAIVRRLGADAADAVLADVATHLPMDGLATGVRRRDSAEPNDEVDATPANVTVLLADDDEILVSSLARMLRRRGYEVLTATTGHNALALCARQRPSVVVADLHMPAVSGRQLAALLRLTLGDSAPPLVILTADPYAPSDMDWVWKVLQKPVDALELVATIELAVTAPTMESA